MKNFSLKKLFTTALLLLSCLATPALSYEWDEPEAEPACEECVSPLYVHFQGGFDLWTDTTSHTPTTTSETEFKTGMIFGVGAGWRFSECLSVEGEYIFQKAKIDTVVSNGVLIADVSGDERVHALMINVLYETPYKFFCCRPFFGAGIGGALFDASAKIAGISQIDDTATTLAFQTLSGMTYQLNECWDLCFLYRNFMAAEPRFKMVNGDAVRSAVQSHSVAIEARWYY